MKVITEFRPEGTRNFIRLGDRVQVTARPPVDKRGFEAIVTRITADDDGHPVEVDVIARTGKHVGRTRIVAADRLSRKAQTRNGKRIEVKR